MCWLEVALVRSIVSEREENIPLLSGKDAANIPLYKDLIEFFFTNTYTKSYTTPYSTFFSHPIFALSVAALAVVCFILTVVSFFIQYHKP